jgi:hypothetical protein
MLGNSGLKSQNLICGGLGRKRRSVSDWLVTLIFFWGIPLSFVLLLIFILLTLLGIGAPLISIVEPIG